jgi:hypothetical protein
MGVKRLAVDIAITAAVAVRIDFLVLARGLYDLARIM